MALVGTKPALIEGDVALRLGKKNANNEFCKSYRFTLM